jgi:hypothetical protein
MSHFSRIPDPGIYRRKLTAEQAVHARHMRDRGMSWPAIAAWFTRNGTPITYKSVQLSAEKVAA